MEWFICFLALFLLYLVITPPPQEPPDAFP